MPLHSALLIFIFSVNLLAAPRVIHVIVALCDNLNQGIVPVPKAIGNGQDPANNLYWGCGFGVKTYFKQQTDWKLVAVQKRPSSIILERLLFKHADSSVFLVADAYDGAFIKQATTDFLNYSAGISPVTLSIDSYEIIAGGASQLLCYVGHDGLMDFELESYPTQANTDKREIIILACASKNYFSRQIRQCGAFPLLWTTNLMCPEAYTLHTAIAGWIRHDTPAAIKEQIAQTYNRFQKCGIKGARILFATGF